MSETLQGVLWTGAALVVVAVLGLVGNVLVKRYRSRASEPEMWARLDKLSLEVFGEDGKPGLRERVETTERVVRAQGYVIRAVARQAPAAGFFPRLDPEYLALIDEDTIPLDHPWRVKP